jgi:hypothetical protein
VLPVFEKARRRYESKACYEFRFIISMRNVGQKLLPYERLECLVEGWNGPRCRRRGDWHCEASGVSIETLFSMLRQLGLKVKERSSWACLRSSFVNNGAYNHKRPNPTIKHTLRTTVLMTFFTE